MQGLEILGWWVHQNAYDCIVTMSKEAIYCIILLIIWMGEFENRLEIVKYLPTLRIHSSGTNVHNCLGPTLGR